MQMVGNLPCAFGENYFGQLFLRQSLSCFVQSCRGNFMPFGNAAFKKDNSEKSPLGMQRFGGSSAQCGTNFRGGFADEHHIRYSISSVFVGKRLYCGSIYGNVRSAFAEKNR